MEPAVGLRDRSFTCVSPAVERRRELLRRGFPKSEALENLRQRILEQRQARLRTLEERQERQERQERLRTLASERTQEREEVPLNKVQHRGQMSRKVCRVTFSFKGQSHPKTPQSDTFKTKLKAKDQNRSGDFKAEDV